MKAPSRRVPRLSADHSEIKYYRVEVNATFEAHNEIFRPGAVYRVTPDIYNGLVNGVPFKDRCSSARPEYQRD